MAAHQGVTKNTAAHSVGADGVNLKDVLKSKNIPASRLHPPQLGEQVAEDTLSLEDVLPQSLEASARLQRKMGLGALSSEEFKRAISEGLVNWRTIYERGKEENIKLVAYALWEAGHGSDAENWAQAENLINTIWDKVESQVNTGTELNNYLNEHQAELKILL